MSVTTWSHSLSVKVIAVFVMATLALFAVLWLTLGMTFQRLLSDNVEPYFTRHLISLQNQVGVPPDISVAKQLAEQNPVIIEIDAPGYRWSSNGTFIESENLDVRLQRVSNEMLISEAGFYHGNFILRTYEQGYIISFIITEKINANPEKQAMWLAIAAIGLIIGALYAVIVFLFKPVKLIERGVKRIGDGEVSHRLPVTRQDELGKLSQSVNKMADNIEQMLEAKRQLLLAISHELRTPITRAKIALSLVDDDTKDSVTEDMNEMEAMIEELLESERLRSNHAPLERHVVNLNDIIYQVQGRFFDDASLTVNADDDLPLVNIDAGRVSLAVKNVIKNALTASQQSQDKVIVTTAVVDNHVIISVSDSGTGIAAEDIPHLTEPFYRPDSSRQRKTGGFGIGLHLIKAVIDAHGGSLNIDSDLGYGTTVTLSLPVDGRG